MNKKTDYQLIEIYKNNPYWKTRRDIEEILYKKYQPLCKSLSIKYHSNSFEDNMQECYFQMIKALEWVNVNKIENEDAFSFGYIFKNYLTSYFNNQLYESYEKIKQKEEINIYQYNDSDEEYCIDIIEKKDFVEESLFKPIISKFKKSMTAIEQQIWDYLEEGKSQKDIAQILNKNSINYTVQKLKSRYIDFMNKNGYAIEL